MPFNGSGAFAAPGASFPAVASTLIESAKFNAVINDIATALSTCITKDGQTTVTANIPFGGNKLTGVGAATARTDAATLASIQDGTGVYVGTVGGTADAITLTPSPAITAYAAGQRFRFIASGANTTNVTVAISGLTAKAVTKNGSTALVANDITSGAIITIEYDGTRFQLVDLLVPADTVTLAGTQTLTNKTLTSPALTTPTIGGNSVGIWTTFTPTVTLVGGAGNTVPVYTTNSGRYSRIGNVVHVNVYLSGDGGAEGAGTGQMNVALPVAAGSGNTLAYIPVGHMINSTSEFLLFGRIQASATTIELAYLDASSPGSVPVVTGASQNNATRTVSLKFSYEV